MKQQAGASEVLVQFLQRAVDNCFMGGKDAEVVHIHIVPGAAF